MTVQFIERYPSCPICASTRLQPAFDLEKHGAAIHWDVCADCLLTFQNPRLADDTIRSIYASDEYWGSADPRKQSAYHNFEQNDHLRVRQSKYRLAKIMDATGIRGGTLLDVGCATGFFGYAAQQVGFQATGIEPSERMANFGRKHYGLSIHQCLLEEFELPNEFYDAVTVWGADSHFLHPKEGFARLAASLKPGGVLALNYQIFTHWIRKIFPGIKKGWNALYLLSEQSLRYLFDHLELDILYHKTEWQYTTLDHIGRITKLGTPRFLGQFAVRVPAVSFPLVIARKRDRKMERMAA